jgi:hypothetical protein
VFLKNRYSARSKGKAIADQYLDHRRRALRQEFGRKERFVQFSFLCLTTETNILLLK